MSQPIDLPGARRGLVALSHQLGDPDADLVVLGEGNTSAALGDGTFLVKASGTRLGGVTEDDLVRLDHAAVLALIDDPELDEHDQPGLAARLRAAIRPSRPEGSGVNGDPDAAFGSGAGPGAGAPGPTGKLASIETMLHALALQLPGTHVVGHTHPTAVNALLCSDRAADLVAGSLFPDQVVVCGAHALLVPYADPGLPLARAVRRGLAEHLDAHGTPPRLIHLANHGIVALGENAAQVLAVTTMAVKAARVLSGALAVGRPRYLEPATVARLDNRPDELHRRRVLTAPTTPLQVAP
ncbi:MAG TPA: class II aldolase/adducin family protein [Pseudonocardia sp.]|jgi:rhamnose utilization protein RhaD (predicted bifunctional aldolase and dehydrogenase)|nr:class II aldolase/adducin family protein [Pseudonocardia sp.]